MVGCWPDKQFEERGRELVLEEEMEHKDGGFSRTRKNISWGFEGKMGFHQIQELDTISLQDDEIAIPALNFCFSLFLFLHLLYSPLLWPTAAITPWNGMRERATV